MPEPWLPGTLTEMDAVRRQVLHALGLAREDVTRWCSGLSREELEARPFGVAPAGFHLRHIARSLDRLLPYAEGQQLNEVQLRALESEMQAGDALAEFERGIATAEARVRAIAPDTLEQPREVGLGRLLSTVGGLLVHCAEHTQRHVGQAITTAQVVMAIRAAN